MIGPEKQAEFETLYEEFWPKIYNFMYSRIQNKQESEELTQEVFHRVYRQLKKKKDIKNLSAYMYMVARNIVYDLWRKQGRRPDTSYIEDMAENGYEPEAEESVVDEGIIVEEMLSKLSKDARDVIILRIIKGYSIEDVAKYLSKPVGTIKSIQFRALKKLRQQFIKGGLIL